MSEHTCKAFTSCLALHRGRFDRMDSDRRVAASIGDPSAATEVEREDVFLDASAAITQNSKR